MYADNRKKFAILLCILGGFGALVLVLPFVNIHSFQTPHERGLAHFQKGRTHFEKGKHAEALIELKSALQADPDMARAYHYLALVHLEMDVPMAAIDALTQSAALNASPDAPLDFSHPELHVHMGMAYQKRGEMDKARVCYEKALALDPDLPLIANNLAWLYADTGEHLDRAWVLAEEAHRQMPDNPDVLDTLAWVYYKRQNFYKATRLLEACVQNYPGHAMCLGHLGMAYAQIGEEAAAWRALEKSLEVDPTHAGADDVRRALAELAGKEGEI